jgi:hypothetical protein
MDYSAQSLWDGSGALVVTDVTLTVISAVTFTAAG